VVQGQAGGEESDLRRPMRFSSLRDGIEAALGRLLDTLCDPKRQNRTVVLMLAAYCAAWTVYAVLAKASQDIHFDMGEMVAWSREIGLGTPKHPPLPAWIVDGWFQVFPLATWAYDLLAMVTAAVALWVAWAVSANYLDDRKRAVGLALLTLVPFFNFHALKYNANTAMMPWWALTTWFFLRSFESRGIGFAALAGLAAGGAMLAKYWSIVLLVALAIAALADPRRRPYFRSAAPYVTAAVGAAALSPHVAWLYLHDFAPFGYALESHPATIVEAVLSGLGYCAGALGYVAAPILLMLVAAMPSRAAIADALWPPEPHRRLAVTVFILPLLLPTLFAAVAAEKVVSLWAIASMTLLPVVLLSSPAIVVSRAAAVRVLGVAVAFPVLAILAAPAVAVWVHRHGVSNYGDQYQLVAQTADKFWREATDRPLRLVGSYNNVLYGTAFYFPERPSTYEIVSPYLTPWTDDARIARDGILIYCPVEVIFCMNALDAWAAKSPQARREDVEIARSFLGRVGPPTRYAILAIPPP
jgi:Dolichyl-phosphate-mannose-protein mannosyltransferase